jgi:hypothetical protein
MSGPAGAWRPKRSELVWVVEELCNVGGSEYMTVLFSSLLENAGVHVRVVAPPAANPVWTARLERSGSEIILADEGSSAQVALCDAARRTCKSRPPHAV